MKAKKILVAFVAMLAMTFMMPLETGATPPPWAPAYGYRAKTRQIYFPQQNMYYDLQRGVYMYVNGGRWAVSASIPAIFANVNLGRAAQVQLAINSNYPYRYNAYHQDYYGKKYWKEQQKAEKEYWKDVRKYNKKAYKYNNNRRYHDDDDDQGYGNRGRGRR